MTEITDDQVKPLRKLNIYAGFLHLGSLIAVLVLANGTSIPVTATYLADAPGRGKYSDPVTLFDSRLAILIALFLGLSAFFHFLVASPKFFERYRASLKKRQNIFRWVEYSMSSSIMIILILQLNGVSELSTILAVFGVNASMILFGWLQEKYTTPGDGDMLPFWFGCIAGSVPWIIVVFNLFSPGSPSGAETPGFVYGIVGSLFVLFNCFAFVQYKQYKAKGKWENYLYGEKRYIVLSFVAKSLLAWQIFAGALAATSN